MKIDSKAFWLARFARIYPLFWLTLLLDTPDLLLWRVARYGLNQAVAKTTLTFLGNCFMLQSWDMRLSGIDTPNWSLSVETFFYLLFPLTGPLIWKLSPAKSWVSLTLLYFGGLAAVSCARQLGAGVEVIEFNPLFHFHEFLGGILIAKLQVEVLWRYRDVLCRFAFSAAVFAVMFFLIGLQMKAYIPHSLIQDGLFEPAYAVLIWSFSSGNRVISLIFSRPWLTLLGEASYGMYLIHMPLFHVYKHLGPMSDDPGIAYMKYLLYLTSTLALSIIAFRYIETPARRFILTSFRPQCRLTPDPGSPKALADLN